MVILPITFLILSNSVYGTNSESDWCEYRHDENHTGLQPIKGYGNILKYDIRWYPNIGNGKDIYSLIYGEPAVFDIDLDGNKEIIFGSDNKNLYCLNSEGKLKWQYSTNGRISCTPTIIDIDNDCELEIIITDGSGKIHMLTNSGSLIWDYDTGASIDASVAVGDINSDGELDIVIGNYNGDLYTISKEGKLIWKYNTGSGIAVTALIKDLNNDNSNEIIIGDMGTGILYAISTEKVIEYENIPRLRKITFSPKVLWQYETQVVDNLGILSSPVLIDSNKNEQKKIIFGSSDGNLNCLNFEGRKIWCYNVGNPIYDSPAVADINFDNEIEIVFTSENFLYNLDSNGNLIWKIQLTLKRNPDPVLFDLDGDGYLEITVPSKDQQPSESPPGTRWINAIDILDYNGKIIYTLKFHKENTDYFHSVSIVDIDDDDKLEILTGTVYGYLYCWGEINTIIEEPPNENGTDNNKDGSDTNHSSPSSFNTILILSSLILISIYVKYFKRKY